MWLLQQSTRSSSSSKANSSKRSTANSSSKRSKANSSSGMPCLQALVYSLCRHKAVHQQVLLSLWTLAASFLQKQHHQQQSQQRQQQAVMQDS
jgi:hypothetical protein